MKYESLEGLALNGSSGGVYSVFKYAHLTEDKYRLPIYEGVNRHNGKLVSILVFEKQDIQKQENRLSFFKNNKELAQYDLATKNGVNFVIFNMSNDEFEKIYFEILPAKEITTILLPKEVEEQGIVIKDKEVLNSNGSKQRRRYSWYITVPLLLTLCLGIGALGTYLRKLAFVPQPPNTTSSIIASPQPLIASSTSTLFAIFSPTVPDATIAPDSTATNTQTLTPVVTADTPTVNSEISLTPTIVVTRTGLPSELNLCVNVAIGARIRSLPNAISGRLETLENKRCLWFNAKFEASKTEMWVHISPDQELIINGKTIVGGWIRSDLLTQNDLSVLALVQSNPEVGYTITLTPTITVTP